MSVTPNFSWPLIEPTDFVTNLPADLETLVDDIDADVWAIKGTADAAIPETIIDAAGDLIYGSAADTVARLAIGTAGQVLKVNSGATAPEWGAPPTADTNWTLLNTGGTATTGAASITVNISAYDKLFIIFDGCKSANTSAIIRLRFNGDTNSNYYQFGPTWNIISSYSTSSFSSAAAGRDDQIRMVEMGSSTTGNMAGAILILGAKSAQKMMFDLTTGMVGTSADRKFRTTKGYYDASAAITSVNISSSSGNLDAGTIYIYGA